MLVDSLDMPEFPVSVNAAKEGRASGDRCDTS